jgi:hypothetical protein
MTAQINRASIEEELAQLNHGDRLAVSHINKTFEAGRIASKSNDNGSLRLGFGVISVQVEWSCHEGRRIFTITSHNREHAVRVWAKSNGGTYSKGRGEVVEVVA